MESLELAASSEHKMFPLIKQDFNSEELQTKRQKRQKDRKRTNWHLVNVMFFIKSGEMCRCGSATVVFIFHLHHPAHLKHHPIKRRQKFVKLSNISGSDD